MYIAQFSWICCIHLKFERVSDHMKIMCVCLYYTSETHIMNKILQIGPCYSVSDSVITSMSHAEDKCLTSREVQ